MGGPRRNAAKVGLVIAMALGLVSPALGSTPLATSRFKTDLQGWSAGIIGGTLASVSWTAGGHPHGAAQGVIQTPASNYFFYWIAPAKYLGDQRAAYKGKLAFDQEWCRNPIGNRFDGYVYLEAGNGDGLINSLGLVMRARCQWDHYAVPLTTSGWKNYAPDPADRTPATGDQMKAVLKDLAVLDIETYDSGSVPTSPGGSRFHLDNVKLLAPG
jgi:hypothetical protein